MMVGMLTGCPPTPPPPPDKTDAEIAAELIEKATAEIAKAETADDIATVEKHVADALEKDPEVDVAAINKAIADQKIVIKKADDIKKRDAFIADGKALLATNAKGALAKAEAALAIDPDCGPAKELKAAAEKKIAAEAGPDVKGEYAKALASFDSAMRSKQYATAIRRIPEVEKWAALGGGPSIANQQKKIEALQLVEEAKSLARNDRDESQLRRANSKLDQAEQKDKNNREIATVRRDVASKLERIRVGRTREREYNAAMAAGSRDATSNSISALERALRAYERAIRLAPDAGSRRRADSAAKTVREKVRYLGHMQNAKQAKNSGQLDRALREVRSALLIRRTSEARTLEREVQAEVALAAAKLAEDAKQWDVAVSQLKEARRFGADVEARLAKAEKMAKTGALEGQIADIKAAVKANNYASIAEQLEILIKQYPENTELPAIKKAGPSRTEVAALNKKALGPYKKALGDIRKKGVAGRPQEEIRILTAALSDVRGSVYEKKLQSMIEKKRDGIFRGQFTKVSQTAKPMKNLDDKIDYLTGERARFEGTSYLKQIDGMITAAKTQKAASAFAALNKSVAPLRKPEQLTQKITMLESAVAQPVYKDTTYVGRINGMITATKNQRAAGEHAKLMKATAPIRKPGTEDQKISMYQAALTQPVYEGTRYVDQIKASIKREKDAKARKPFADLNARVAKARPPQAKLAILEGEVNNAIFEGTSHKDQIKRDIETQKGIIKTNEFKAVSLSVRDPKKSFDAKIDYLNSQKPNFAGTRYEKSLASMISREMNAKMAKAFADLSNRVNREIKTPRLKIAEMERQKPAFAGTTYDAKIAGMIQREKDGIAAKTYGDLMKRIKTIKDPNEVISQLEQAKQGADIVGTRYEKMIQDRITKEKTTLKSKQYSNMMREMNDPKAKRNSAAKAEFLRSNKGSYRGTTFEKKIDAQIKGFEGRIAAERKAAAAADAKAKAAAERKRKADADRAAAAARKKADVEASKVYGKVTKALKPAKTPADCDANIQKLIDAKQQVAGSNYVARIDGLIKKQRSIKAKLEKAPPKPR
jgi:hypothetical protein